MCESWGDMEKKLRDILTNSAVAETTKEACAWKTLALAVGMAEKQRQEDREKVKKLQDQLDEQKLFTNVLVGTVNRLRNTQEREKEKARYQLQESVTALRGIEEERNLLRNELLKALSAQSQKQEGAVEYKRGKEAQTFGTCRINPHELAAWEVCKCLLGLPVYCSSRLPPHSGTRSGRRLQRCEVSV
ncbi:testis-expressed protein 13B-like [Ailuropoda melanoleuca]|uniref:testis-expressed protein 13B-like n=1 Tax=Ailuropoda melanoleuca TaxID=9646 RepID=UPI001493EFCE|nr:testis-expressed protein 13B-like [Ailuropoda melanoleuca]